MPETAPLIALKYQFQFHRRNNQGGVRTILTNDEMRSRPLQDYVGLYGLEHSYR